MFARKPLVRAANTAYNAMINAFKSTVMPLPAHLSDCHQQRITVDIVGQVTQPDLYPGSNHTNTAQDKIACHHRLYPKHMFNSGAFPCPRPVSLLLPFGQLAVLTAFALQMLPKSPLFKLLYGLLRPVGRISIHITAAVILIQKLFKHLTVMYRRIRHCIAPNELVCVITTISAAPYDAYRFLINF